MPNILILFDKVYERTLKKRSFLIAISGILLVLLGFISFFTIPSFIIEEIYQRLQIRPNTDTYKIWKEAPFPVFTRFYFFNITNSDEIERYGVKPIVNEIGPFTYRTIVRKNNINLNNNGTISYKESKIFIFERDLSISSENTVLITLNAPLAFTLTLIQSASPSVRFIVTLSLDAVTEGFFIKRTVKQLLFDGYPDLLTTFGPLLNPSIPSNNQGRFGFMYPKNNTEDGQWTVFTGETGLNNINLINTFNGKEKLNYWASDECNDLKHTTNGQLQSPFNIKKDFIVYNAELCRKLKFKYDKDISKVNLNNLTVKRYVLDENTFKNSQDYEPNSCYISKLPKTASNRLLNFARNSLFGLSSRSSISRSSSSISQTQNEQRAPLPSGVFDMSACRYGVPVFLSSPHFLNSDPYYHSTIIGLRPNKTAHQFTIDVHPLTGSTVSLAARVQVNIQLNKAPGLFRYRNIPEMIYPIFWQEVTFEINENVANSLNLASILPEKIASITGYSFITFGLIALFIVLIFILWPVFKLLFVENKQTDDNVDKTTGSTAQDLKHIISRRPLPNPPVGIDNPIPVVP